MFDDTAVAIQHDEELIVQREKAFTKLIKSTTNAIGLKLHTPSKLQHENPLGAMSRQSSSSLTKPDQMPQFESESTKSTE